MTEGRGGAQSPGDSDMGRSTPGLSARKGCNLLRWPPTLEPADLADPLAHPRRAARGASGGSCRSEAPRPPRPPLLAHQQDFDAGLFEHVRRLAEAQDDARRTTAGADHDNDALTTETHSSPRSCVQAIDVTDRRVSRIAAVPRCGRVVECVQYRLTSERGAGGTPSHANWEGMGAHGELASF